MPACQIVNALFTNTFLGLILDRYGDEIEAYRAGEKNERELDEEEEELQAVEDEDPDD